MRSNMPISIALSSVLIIAITLISCALPETITSRIYYSGNGNTSGYVPIDSNSHEIGNSVIVLGNYGNLQKDGFLFVGWNTKADGSGVTYFSGQSFYIGPVDIVLYAVWQEATYFTITYDGNSNTSGAPPIEELQYLYTDTVTAFENSYNLAREAYIFAGWNTKSDGSGIRYDEGEEFLMPSGSIILYAMWLRAHSIFYHPNGADSGIVPVDQGDYLLDDPVTILENTGSLQKHEHTFGNWNTKPDGTGELFNAGSLLTMPDADVDLYAVWKINTYTVTFNTNGGSLVHNQIINYGNLITAPLPPTKQYYSFGGWYLDTALSEQWNVGEDIVATNLTLYAKWDSLLPSSFEDGDGTIENPYQIATPGQLYLVRDHLDKHFIQTADLDLSDFNSGQGWEPLGSFWGEGYGENTYFTGSFDGNGYLIRNLSINNKNRDAVGLFGHTLGNAKIKNVRLTDVTVHGRQYVGGLIGRNNSVEDVENCSVSGSIIGDKTYVGGLIGVNTTANLVDCSVTGNITGGTETGGLVGQTRGNIEHCYTDIIVMGRQKAGGLVGYFLGDNISNCHSGGNIVSTTGALIFSTGGLVGENSDGHINNCYSIVDVKGSYLVGGLVGKNEAGIISNCRVSGKVVGSEDMPSSIGGFIGSNGGEIYNCSTNATVKGLTNTGGFAGSNGGSIQECFSTGSVVGTKSVGGFVGYLVNSGNVANSYAKGAVNGSERVGGFIGQSVTSTGKHITNCYSIGTVVGNSGLGGFAGVVSIDNIEASFYDMNTSGLSNDIGRGTPKSTTEMMQESTYVGWDFDMVWSINQGTSYPYLQWEDN